MTTCANPWSVWPAVRLPDAGPPRRGIAALLLGWALSCAGFSALAQDDSAPGLGDVEIARSFSCFGFTDIENPRALEICDALSLEENVRARELGEEWIRLQPDSPAAQFSYAEVLYTAEGNLARALFHLNRAESLTGYADINEAVESGNIQWHYLTLSQLSNVHQLMGDQQRALDYLDRIEEIYGQDIESFRGWPLLKLKQYDAARASAMAVLENSENERERARAWNTLCAVELASLAPVDSMAVCNRAISEERESRRPVGRRRYRLSDERLGSCLVAFADGCRRRLSRPRHPQSEPRQRRRSLGLQALYHHEPGPFPSMLARRSTAC